MSGVQGRTTDINYQDYTDGTLPNVFT